MRIRIEFADNGVIIRDEQNWVDVIQDEDVREFALSQPICAYIGKEVMRALDKLLDEENEAFDGANIDVKIKLQKKVSKK